MYSFFCGGFLNLSYIENEPDDSVPGPVQGHLIEVLPLGDGGQFIYRPGLGYTVDQVPGNMSDGENRRSEHEMG